MKILFWRLEYYGALTTGGFASHYEGLINAFIKLNHQCVYVTSGKINPIPNVKHYLIKHNNLLKNLPEVLNLPYNYFASKELLKILEIEKPDFIFLQHHDFIYPNYYLKKWGIDIPIILFVDGYQYWVKTNWGKLYLKQLHKKSEEIAWYYSDKISVISQGVLDQIVDAGVDKSKTFLSPSCVDPDFFSPIQDNIELKLKLENEHNIKLEDKFICGYTGTFAQWHGVFEIAKSVNLLKEKIPNILILMVGDGMLRSKFEEILIADNTLENVIITGLVPFKDVPKYLSLCDLLMTPSVHNEDGSLFFNSPIKIYEYMSMEKPIVASNIGEQGILIKNEINGFLHNSSDLEGFVDTIGKVKNNPELSQKAAKQARIDVINNHDWKVNALQLINEYEKIKKIKRINS